MEETSEEEFLSVTGILSYPEKQPFIRLFKDGSRIAHMTMEEARNFAHDILNMCARTEADAIIYKFFERTDLPREAAMALMRHFRDFRLDVDSEPVEDEPTQPV